MFDETLAYALPRGSITVANHLQDQAFNGLGPSESLKSVGCCAIRGLRIPSFLIFL
jgi:hypothetical protein